MSDEPNAPPPSSDVRAANLLNGSVLVVLGLAVWSLVVWIAAGAVPTLAQDLSEGVWLSRAWMSLFWCFVGPWMGFVAIRAGVRLVRQNLGSK